MEGNKRDMGKDKSLDNQGASTSFRGTGALKKSAGNPQNIVIRKHRGRLTSTKH